MSLVPIRFCIYKTFKECFYSLKQKDVGSFEVRAPRRVD